MLEPTVSIITCTGARPQAFALCKYFVERQSYTGPIQWIIVDDCVPALDSQETTRKNLTIEQYTGPKIWEPGVNTQRFNMEGALKKVAGDYLVIMEDDDFYHPKFIETNVKLLQHFQVVGECNAKYYNVALNGAYKLMHNYRHASLSQTGFRKSAIPLLRKAVDSGEMYFDIHLWRSAHEQRLPVCLYSESQLSVGIKGMPGRDGLGAGHKVKDYILDPAKEMLKKWVGDDADLYTQFMTKPTMKKETYDRPVKAASGAPNAIPAKLADRVQS